MKKETASSLLLSIVILIAVVFALYYSLMGLGIEWDKAVVEALVIGSAIITPAVLYLFGRGWKKETGKGN